MNKKMEQINRLWQSWCALTKELADLLGNRNIVGQYTEMLFVQYLKGNLAATSKKSYDLLGEDGKRYQVKGRQVERHKTTTKLGIIRSWDFDFLAVALFDSDEVGDLILAIIFPVDVVRKYAKSNDHEHGWAISTTKKFLRDAGGKDVTAKLKEILKQSAT